MFVTGAGQRALASVRQRHAKSLLRSRHPSHPGHPEMLLRRRPFEPSPVPGRHREQEFIVLSSGQGEGCRILLHG